MDWYAKGVKRKCSELSKSGTNVVKEIDRKRERGTHIIHLVCRIINRQNAKHKVILKMKMME